VWNNRDTSSGGYKRNDKGERAPPSEGHGTMSILESAESKLTIT
jgi:hypothetical protein